MDNILYTGKKTMSKIVNGENMGMERSDTAIYQTILVVHVYLFVVLRNLNAGIYI
jgi:hypothetical protein